MKPMVFHQQLGNFRMKKATNSKRLDLTKYVKISQVLTENKTKWGTGTKTVSDLCRLLESDCKFEIPESTLKKIIDELGYKVKRTRRVTNKTGSNDRTRFVAMLINKMFVDLERQLGMENGIIGCEDGTRDTLISITRGVSLEQAIDVMSSYTTDKDTTSFTSISGTHHATKSISNKS